MPKSVKKVLQNSFFQTFGAFGITGLNFVLMLGYARLLGPGSLGELIAAQAHVLVWTAVVDLGLSNALISTLTKAEDDSEGERRQGFRARDVLRRVLFLRILGASVASAAVLSYAFIRSAEATGFNTDLFAREIAFLPHLFALAVQQTAVAYATYRERQGLAIATMLLSAMITVALPLALAVQGASVTVLLLSQCWGGFLSAALIAIVLYRSEKRSSTRRATVEAKTRGKRNPWHDAATRALWQSAWPFGFSYAAVVLWQRLDQIAVSEWLGYEAAGQYGLAVRLAAIPMLIATSISHAIFPDLQRLGLGEPEKVRLYIGATLKVVFRHGLIFVGIVFVGVYLLVAPLVPKFQPGLAILPWFIAGVWFHWLQTFVIGGLFGLRAYRAVMLAYVHATLALIVLLTLLTKPFGLSGVAVASSSFPIVLFLSALSSAVKLGVVENRRVWSRYSPEEMGLLRPIKDRFFGLVSIKVGRKRGS